MTNTLTDSKHELTASELAADLINRFGNRLPIPPMAKSEEHISHWVYEFVTQSTLRYMRLIRENTPEFSCNEWFAIVDSLSCALLDFGDDDNDDLNCQALGANLVDADFDNDKWEIDKVELAARLDNLPHSQALAVLEVAARFWEKRFQSGASHCDCLVAAGAKVRAAETA